MKIKNLTKLFLFVAVALLVSCSSSEDNGDGGGSSLTSITISSTSSSITFGDAFTFTVKDNNNNDVTSQSTIYFGGVEISSTHTPTASGTFVVNAVLNDLSSNSISVTVNQGQSLSSIVVNADRGAALPGETIILSSVGNEGTDFTSASTFYVNGTAIEGNSFVAQDRGNTIVTATYETYTSNQKLILVGHKQKVLVEDYTGTWCGWCPRVAYGIELVEGQTDDAVIVAIHRGNSSGSFYDPYNYPAGSLEDVVGVDGYPTAKINRMTTWSFPEPNNVSQVVDFTTGVASKGLGLDSSLSGNTLNVSVKMNILTGSLSGLKLVVYVLEDGLILDQTNYTDYYGGVSTIQNFTHNHVLRQVPTDLFGDVISVSDLDTASGSYVKDYSFSLASSIANTNNLTLTAFIVDENGNALNVQSAAVGETKDFD